MLSLPLASFSFSLVFFSVVYLLHDRLIKIHPFRAKQYSMLEEDSVERMEWKFFIVTWVQTSVTFPFALVLFLETSLSLSTRSFSDNPLAQVLCGWINAHFVFDALYWLRMGLLRVWGVERYAEYVFDWGVVLHHVVALTFIPWLLVLDTAGVPQFVVLLMIHEGGEPFVVVRNLNKLAGDKTSFGNLVNTVAMTFMFILCHDVVNLVTALRIFFPHGDLALVQASWSVGFRAALGFGLLVLSVLSFVWSCEMIIKRMSWLPQR